jgi:hypothetical protein
MVVCHTLASVALQEPDKAEQLHGVRQQHQQKQQQQQQQHLEEAQQSLLALFIRRDITQAAEKQLLMVAISTMHIQQPLAMVLVAKFHQEPITIVLDLPASELMAFQQGAVMSTSAAAAPQAVAAAAPQAVAAAAPQAVAAAAPQAVAGVAGVVEGGTLVLMLLVLFWKRRL